MNNGEQPGTYGATGGGGSKKLQQTHAQVNEVVDIMRENVEKVIDRDIKLSELDDRADALQQGASQFETQAAKLKRKYWWKNMQMWLILGALGLIVIIIIVVSQSKGGNANANSMGNMLQPAVQPAAQPVAPQAQQPSVPSPGGSEPTAVGATVRKRRGARF